MTSRNYFQSFFWRPVHDINARSYCAIVKSSAPSPLSKMQRNAFNSNSVIMRICSGFRNKLQSFIYSPPVQTHLKGGNTKSNSLSPCGDGLGFSGSGDKDVVAAIIRLLFWSFPATILRCVITTIVNTPKGVFKARLRPQVGIESFKRVTPAFADSNAASSIPWIALMFRIAATASHVKPRTVFRRFSHSMGGKQPTRSGISFHEMSLAWSSTPCQAFSNSID